MKKGITILLLLITISSYSQLKNFPVHIFHSDIEVTQYLDSLNKLKSNPYYKVERKYNTEGDLILSSSFALDDESFYGCLDVMFLFVRQNGKEYCLKQIIMGGHKYAERNINWVKDNYKYISPGKWEYDYNAQVKITASLDTKDTIGYTLVYEMEFKEPKKD